LSIDTRYPCCNATTQPDVSTVLSETFWISTKSLGVVVPISVIRTRLDSSFSSHDESSKLTAVQAVPASASAAVGT